MVKEFSYKEVKRFFKTRGGKNLDIQNKEAQLLAYSLLASPSLDPSGYYSIQLQAITTATNLSQEKLPALFSELENKHFCQVDFQKQRVFVPVVAEVFAKLFAKQDADYLTQEKI